MFRFRFADARKLRHAGIRASVETAPARRESVPAMADIAFVTGAHVDQTGRLFEAPIPGVSNPGAFVARPGGAGLNAASATAALGVGTALASPLGPDENGRLIRRTLAQRGIADGLVEMAGARTGVYTAIVAPDGDMVIGVADLAIYEAVDADWLLHHCAETLNPAALWFVNANLSAPTLAGLAARKAGRRLAGATISPAKAPRLRPVLNALDFLFTNVAEARALTGEPGAGVVRLVEALMAAGVRAGTLSQGGGPLHWWSGAARGVLTPPAVARIVDVNGAGDALAGTVLAGLWRGDDFETAARHGVAAAQLTLSTPEPFHAGLCWAMLEAIAPAPAAR